LTESMSTMSPEQVKTLVDDLHLNTTDLTPQAVAFALQAGVRLSGFLAYELALIVANTVAKAVLGRGLSLAANATITRAVSLFAGPAGWILTGLWTAFDIAGPAYRVTIPAVIQIAFLRLKMKYALPGQTAPLPAR